MRKFIAMLLALCMVFCLCACGGDGKEAEAPAETPSAANDEQASAPTEAPSDEAEEEAAVQAGTLSGSTYENAFLGIGCTLDENWTFASEEELAQMIGQTAEMFDDDYAEQLKEADMFYDMVAVTEEGMVSINVVIQNVGLLYGTVLSEDKYLEIAEEQMAEQLGNAGMENVQTERISANFAGAEHGGLHISCTIQDVPYYCTQMCIKQGKYIASISLCSFTEDYGSDMMGFFYGL